MVKMDSCKFHLLFAHDSKVSVLDFFLSFSRYTMYTMYFFLCMDNYKQTYMRRELAE